MQSTRNIRKIPRPATRQAWSKQPPGSDVHLPNADKSVKHQYRYVGHRHCTVTDIHLKTQWQTCLPHVEEWLACQMRTAYMGSKIHWMSRVSNTLTHALIDFNSVWRSSRALRKSATSLLSSCAWAAPFSAACWLDTACSLTLFASARASCKSLTCSSKPAMASKNVSTVPAASMTPP